MGFEDSGSRKVQAAGITRDVIVALAGVMEKPGIGYPDEAVASSLVKVYEAVHTAALKSMA